MIVLLNILSSICTLTGLWLFVCNVRTHRHLSYLNSQVYFACLHRLWTGDDWESLTRDFESVSYGRYLWRLFTFRDPLALLSVDILRLVKRLPPDPFPSLEPIVLQLWRRRRMRRAQS